MAELRNIRWRRFLKSLLEKDSLPPLLKSRSLQWWLTVGFRKNGFLLLDDLDDLILEYKGIRVYPDLLNYPRVFEAWDRYRIETLKSSDLVLDIGANIGSYTLPAAKRVSKVFSVEPLYWEELDSNVRLNLLNNVEILPKGISNFIGTGLVDCQEISGRVQITSFERVFQLFKSKYESPPTIVRLDCGGAEWRIDKRLLADARVLEVEFHFWEKKEGTLSYWENWKRFLRKYGFGYVARWSKHRHWLYLSADKTLDIRQEVQLEDGSFRGNSRKLWRLSSRGK